VLTPSRLLKIVTDRGGDPPPHLIASPETKEIGDTRESYIVWYCSRCGTRFTSRDNLSAMLAAISAHWHDGYGGTGQREA
jgi:hypothetical protein